MAEQVAHRAAWRDNRRLVAAARVEPGAVDAGDRAREVGDGGDQRRPSGANVGVVVPVRPIEAARFRRGLLVGRLQALEAMGMAGREGDTWRLTPDAEAALRAMSERGDIVRTMQRALGAERRAFDVHKEGPPAPIVGRVAGKGLVDELQDRGYLIVDGIDGRAHYVAMPAGTDLATFPKNGIVEVAPSSSGPRPADRTIARIAAVDGFYRPDHHLAEAERIARASENPKAFVEAHVRRLEALRREGIVERINAGLWRVPPDFLERAGAYEAARGAGLVVTLRSHLSLGEQVRATGASWLDRSLLGTELAPAASGFGAEVRSALAARQEMLIDEGLASRRAQRVILAKDLLATLRDREVAKVAAGLTAETGLVHRPVHDGASVRGVYRRSVLLASGRFALLDDGIGFSLVPWNPVIEPKLGRSISGVVRGGAVSWDLSRSRGRSV